MTCRTGGGRTDMGRTGGVHGAAGDPCGRVGRNILLGGVGRWTGRWGQLAATYITAHHLALHAHAPRSVLPLVHRPHGRLPPLPPLHTHPSGLHCMETPSPPAPQAVLYGCGLDLVPALEPPSSRPSHPICAAQSSPRRPQCPAPVPRCCPEWTGPAGRRQPTGGGHIMPHHVIIKCCAPR